MLAVDTLGACGARCADSFCVRRIVLALTLAVPNCRGLGNKAGHDADPPERDNPLAKSSLPERAEPKD